MNNYYLSLSIMPMYRRYAAEYNRVYIYIHNYSNVRYIAVGLRCLTICANCNTYIIKGIVNNYECQHFFF